MGKARSDPGLRRSGAGGGRWPGTRAPGAGQVHPDARAGLATSAVAALCRRRAGTRTRQKARSDPGLSRPGCSGCAAGRASGDQAALAVARALMRALRRLLWRAALFLWIRPRALRRSSSGWAALKASCAVATSLASSALITFFTAVRSIERWLLLRWLRTMVCLARFLADLMLATLESWKRVWWERRCPAVAGSRTGARRKLWWIQELASTNPA